MEPALFLWLRPPFTENRRLLRARCIARQPQKENVQARCIVPTSPRTVRYSENRQGGSCRENRPMTLQLNHNRRTHIPHDLRDVELNVSPPPTQDVSSARVQYYSSVRFTR